MQSSEATSHLIRLTRGLAAALILASAPAAEPEKPNVILIMADDLGYRDLGCYGHPEIKTPVLDRLAAEGMRLTNFHSGATVCTPSRMGLLTGAYPVRLGWTQGVVGYLIPRNQGMNPEALTLAEIFRSEDYATAISGKWHIGSGANTSPMAQGFDEAFHVKLSNNQTKKLWHGDELVANPFENRLLTQNFTDAAIRFIRKQGDHPFFLYLPYTAPHFPVEAHPDWKGRSSFGEYGDVVEEMDARIGEILKVLDELKLRKRTLIVFTSDNGPQGGQRSSAFPYRGGKWSALEGGTRVPCIVNWPGVVPGGRESDGLLAAIDLLPSLSRACGIDWRSKSEDKPKIDGVEAWDMLCGKQPQSPRKSLLHWQGKSPEPEAVQLGNWKLFFDGRDALDGPGVKLGTREQLEKVARCEETLDSAAPASPLLYELQGDPGEIADFSRKEPERVSELREEGERLRADLAAKEPLPLTVSEEGP